MIPSWKLRNESPWALVFYFVIAISFSGCFSKERAALEKTVLTVNGTTITTKVFADRLAHKLKNYDALYAKDESVLDRAKEETIQSFLIESIARRYAEKQNIKVTEAEIDGEVAAIKSKYPDEFAFRRSLANENMPIEEWRAGLELTILQKKIFDVITKNLEEPSETQIKTFYEANKAQFQKPARVRLRQIVLEKEDDAKRILEELSKSGDMATLAKKFSIAPEGQNGGDTGWLEKGTLDVFEPAFKMNVGARSKIIKSPFGYHIYEVLKKEPETRLSLADAKAKIRSRLMEAEAQKAFTTWLEAEVRKSSVRRDDTVIRAIKVTTRGS